MSAKSIQRKIDSAHRKIGDKLGTPYTVYRPLNNIDVLDDANIVYEDVKSTFTMSDKYTKAFSSGKPIWTCYTAAGVVEEGDFLYSETEGRTFFIMARHPLHPVLAMEVNDRMDVYRTGYGDDGNGWRPDVRTLVARNLPCDLGFGASSFGGLVPARTIATAGTRVATITTSLPRSVMAMGLSVESDGFIGDVISYNYSSSGTALNITAQEFVTSP